MTGRLLVIFLVSILLSNLAYGVPKLEKRIEIYFRSLWTRIGLDKCVESQDHSEPINETDTLSYQNDAESEESVTSAVEYSDTYHSHEKLQLNTRSVQVGDTFMTQEMLPIAKKLMKKIGNRRGKGKGIITSATCSKILADNLFERFFVSMKRIVILKDVDIAGLDALQALALSGEVTGSRSAVNSLTNWRVNGEKLYDGKPISKCHFKVLKKRIDRKGRIAVSKRKVKRRRGASKAEDVCRWRYECTDRTRLESCGLHPDCSKDSALYMGLKLNPDELTDTYKQFRRMVGVDVLDEEVEKILEKRYLLLRPQKFEPSERVESIADYFNKIMIREELDAHQTSPTPMHSAHQKQQEGYDGYDATPGPPQVEAEESEILVKKDNQPAEEEKQMPKEGKDSVEKEDQPAEEDEEPEEEDEQLPEDEQLAEEDVQDESTETNTLEAKR